MYGEELVLNTSIFFFSATGNCLEIVQDIQNSLGDVKGIFMPSQMKKEVIKPTTRRVGFVFPVYYYGIPLVVRDFIKKLDLSDVEYAFAVATCNFLPGLALEKVDELLKEKGRKLNSAFFIRMPGNYIPMYSANSPKTQENKFKKKAKKISFIVDCIRNNRARKIEKSKFIFDRLLAPKMQKYIDKFYEMDYHFWVDEKCNGCGICQRVCAFNNIEMKEGNPDWQHKCQQCFACIHLCPKASIQIDKKTMNKKRYKNPNITITDLVNLTNNFL